MYTQDDEQYKLILSILRMSLIRPDEDAVPEAAIN